MSEEITGFVKEHHVILRSSSPDYGSSWKTLCSILDEKFNLRSRIGVHVKVILESLELSFDGYNENYVFTFHVKIWE